MLDGTDPDAAERLVDDWQAGFEQRAAQARELAARLARLSASARSDDGLVTVTVGPDGAMTGLELEEEVRRTGRASTSRVSEFRPARRCFPSMRRRMRRTRQFHPTLSCCLRIRPPNPRNNGNDHLAHRGRMPVNRSGTADVCLMEGDVSAG